VELVSLMLQIGEGMKYMHGKGVAHRDLKPNNVLINFESKGSSRICSVKIADFGSTKAAERTETNTAHIGTTRYMAPEVMKAEGGPEKARLNLLKADIYSFAITSIHILTGKYPYEYTNPEIIERSKAGERPLLRYALPNLPMRLASLLTKCWSQIPRERPPFTEVCRELRYIKGLLLKDDEQKLQSEIPSPGPLNLLGSMKLEGPWGNSSYGEEFCDIMGTSIEKIELGYSDLQLESLFNVTYKISGKTILKSYLKNYLPTYATLKSSYYISRTIEFQHDEFIKQIEVCVYALHGFWTVSSLTIYTNLEIHGPFGEERGTKYTSDTGSRVIGFHGKGGRYLYCLGVVTVPDV
jgi:serine/threonine protein kinase